MHVDVKSTWKIRIRGGRSLPLTLCHFWGRIDAAESNGSPACVGDDPEAVLLR